MPDLKATLSSIEGKYALVAAVGVGGVLWWRKQHAGATTAAASADTAAGDTSQLAADQSAELGMPTAGGPGGYYGSGQAASSTDLTGGVAAGGVATNADWTNQAVSLLQGYGRDAGTVLTALSKYLAGAPITTAEQAVVQQALAVTGQPPSSAPPVTLAPNGPPPTQQKPPLPASSKTHLAHLLHLEHVSPSTANKNTLAAYQAELKKRGY